MTAKKTTKKTAKKTYPATKKTLPELRRMTFKELTVYMAENHAKTEAAIDRLSIEHEKTERALQIMVRTVNELSRNVGNVNNKLGSIVEFIVIPQIRHSINSAGGHSFTNVMADTRIRAIIDDEKKDIAQMDVFLYNDTEAMAVEIKTDLHIHDVNDHLDRLQKLRKYEEKIDIVRKKLFGAVAGVIVDGRARTLALENGLYVVKIREDEEMLDIEKPDSCRAW